MSELDDILRSLNKGGVGSEDLSKYADKLKSLRPEDMAYLEELLKELERGDTSLLDALWEEDYERTVVTPEQFLKDDYYLGGERAKLWPTLQKDFIDLFDKDYMEVIATGAIGWGKTHFAAFSMVRMVYEVSCLRNPQAYFGIADRSPIVFMNLSVTGQQATSALYQYVQNLIDESPYFKEVFPRNPKTSSALVFPKYVQFVPGNSSEISALGQNILGGAIDEFNKLVDVRLSQSEKMSTSTGEADHAMNLYNAIKRRIKSRFMKHGKVLGKLFLMSSRQHPNDALEKHIKNLQREQEADSQPTTKIMDYPQWGTRPPELFSGANFRVEIGDVTRVSRILQEEESPVEGAKVLDVPVEYKDDFGMDVEGALRDIGGISVLTIEPFMPNRQALHDGIDTSRGHPFTKEVTTLRDARFLAENLVFEGKPIRHANAPRFIHMDLAKNGDYLGFAMGCAPGMKAIQQTDLKTGQMSHVDMPFIFLDLLLRVTHPPGGEIQLADVRQLVIDLRDLGFAVKKVTADQYASVDMLQILQSRGFEAELLSVDRTMTPYMHFKQAVYDRRISYYRYPPMLEDSVNLRIDRARNKVDHPIGGHKDVTDAIAGVCNNIMEDDSLPIGFSVSSDISLGADRFTGASEQDRVTIAGSERPNRLTSPDTMEDDYLTPPQDMY